MDYSSLAIGRKLRAYKSIYTKIINKAALILAHLVLAAFLVVITGGIAIALGVYLSFIGGMDMDFEFIVIEPLNYTTKIVDRYGNEVGGFKGEENREYADFDDVSDYLKQAIIAIEDERFYSHNGIDIRSIVRSMREVFLNNNLQGASTITQQLIKMNITKVQRNSLDSKLREQIIAIQYEEFLTEQLGDKELAKDYILGAYMNSIPMHHGLYGVAAAAAYYFDKPVSNLTLSEATVLAGITNNPAKYAPDRRP